MCPKISNFQLTIKIKILKKKLDLGRGVWTEKFSS